MRVGAWLTGVVLGAVSLTAQTRATVPFVGCAADGQAGPAEAPTGTDPTLPISAKLASRLAYYDGGGLRVFAPRGWNCIRIYGSGGEYLMISPEPISVQHLFSHDWDGLAGPAVQLSSDSA